MSMSLPLILVIDDQYGSDEDLRNDFCNDAGLRRLGDDREPRAIGEAVFCRGQRIERANGEEAVSNDLECVRQAVRQANREQQWSLALLDMRFDSGRINADGTLSGQSGDESFGHDVYNDLSREFPELPIVMLSGMSERELVETRDSQYNYLSKKDLSEQSIAAALLKYGRIGSSQARQLLNQFVQAGEKIPETHVLASNAIRMAYAQALKIAIDDNDDSAPVMIRGESGVGKEALAWFIHYASQGRAPHPFRKCNCAELVEEQLARSILAGVERGVGPGIGQRAGIFRSANKGTAFLDEIATLPTVVQPMLLRAIEQKEVEPLGADGPQAVDVRVIAATNEDIADQDAFRGDLFQRFRHTITIPPLRERREDIPEVIEHFLARQGNGTTVAPEYYARLTEELQYRGGNIRELENMLTNELRGKVGTSDLHLTGRGVGEYISAGPANSRTEQSTAQSAAKANSARDQDNSLAALADRIDSTRIASDADVLRGILPRLEEAYEGLKAAITGAALSCCRNPNNDKFNQRGAAELLDGKPSGNSQGPKRMWNKALRRDGNAKVTDDDLRELVNTWQEWNKKSSEDRSRS